MYHDEFWTETRVVLPSQGGRTFCYPPRRASTGRVFSMGPPEGSVLTFESFFLSSKNLFFLPMHKEEKEEEEGLECCLCLLRLLISWVKKEGGIWLLSLFLEPKESHMWMEGGVVGVVFCFEILNRRRCAPR